MGWPSSPLTLPQPAEQGCASHSCMHNQASARNVPASRGILPVHDGGLDCLAV